MFKFFRKIRQQLLSENKFTKYLAYATGEILLVVIGILIALQINNWNEERKNRELERELLVNLVENLEQNIERMDDRLENIGFLRHRGSIIINALENENEFIERFKYVVPHALMESHDLQLSTIGYQAINNAGFELISNDDLKNYIVVFFEEIQPSLISSLSWGEIDLADRERFIDEHFLQDPLDEELVYQPFQPDEIFKSQYFKSLIYKTDNQRLYYAMRIEEHREITLDLINGINVELAQ